MPLALRHEVFEERRHLRTTAAKRFKMVEHAIAVKDLSFDSVGLRHQIYTEKVNLGDFRDDDKNTALIDLRWLADRLSSRGQHWQPGEGPVSHLLNNLPINASSNAVEECLAEGQQDTLLEGGLTSLISPGNRATLEFSALVLLTLSPAGGNPQAD